MRDQRPPSTESDEADGRIAVWAFLWAAATLFSLTSAPGWFIDMASTFPSVTWFLDAALAIAALLTMLRPRCVGLLSMLALLQLAHAAELAPAVPNHRLIMAFANVSLLIAVARARRSVDAVWTAFVPTARCLVIVVYVFAFLAKLNGDFFDPGVSCAGRFYGQIKYWLPLLPAWGGGVGAWGTVVVEATLPVFLAVPALRFAGVVLGIWFHFVLSFDPLQHLVNFSSVMSALLVLFLPDGWFAKTTSLPLQARAGTFRALACLAFVALVTTAFRAIGNDTYALAYYALRQVMFVVYAGAIFAGVVAFAKPTAEARIPLPHGALQAFVVAVAVINGLSPYLGLKTRTSFNMYSNLRVEADQSNHYLVPRSLDLLGILSDTVTIVRTNDTNLARLAERGSKLTWFEFASYVNETPGIEVWYARNGEVRHLDAKRGTSMPVPPPWLLRKLLSFRVIGGEAALDCVW